MSQEHIETVRAVYERWSEGDFDASAELLDASTVLVVNPGFPDPGIYLGREAIAAYTRSAMLETWKPLTIEAENLFAEGDSVLVDVHQRGVGTSSGAPAELRYFTLWSFRGGRVIRLESWRERPEALEALGLLDSGG